MFVNQFQKLFFYVGGHVHTEGWIEPNDISGSVSYSFRRVVGEEKERGLLKPFFFKTFS